jgi:hypothetical protein
MTKMIAMLACLAFAGSAIADDRKPSNKAGRQTEILRSLDRIELQIVKARQKIDRLEAEMQSLREELTGVTSIGPEVVEPASVEMPQTRSQRRLSTIPDEVAEPDSVEGVPMRRPRSVRSPIPEDVIDPSTVPLEDRPRSDGATGDPRKPKVFPIGDPNFASPGTKEEQEATPGPSGSEYLLIIPSEGDKVVAFDKTTRKSLPLVLSEDKSIRHLVIPVVAQAIVGLTIEGPKISRLAVFSIKSPGTVPAWNSIELREPVDSARPDVENYGPVLYTLGHRVYAFSPQAARWDVLELPKGVVPQKGDGSNAGPTIEHDGHIYTFVTMTGQWSDLDTKAILGETPDQKPK